MLQVVPKERRTSPRPEIPQISDERLAELARIIKPVISCVVTPMGHYPSELVYTRYLKLPRDLRGENLLAQRCRFFGRVRLVEEARIRTLHVPGSAGRVFHPTIAEVLAQIPERMLSPTLPVGCHLVAFETFLEKGLPERDESGYLHQATTVLLARGSRVSGWHSYWETV